MCIWRDATGSLFLPSPEMGLCRPDIRVERGLSSVGSTWAANISCVSHGSADARTVSSGSSAWEGQLQSMILSEYASTEMSLHALYMHEVSSLELGQPKECGASVGRNLVGSD